MENVVFFNKLAELRANPTYKNLLELAKEDPAQADIEINDFTHVASGYMTDRENIFWLLGYLQGICSTVSHGSHKNALKELESRINKFWYQGEFKYRTPYNAPLVKF